MIPIPGLGYVVAILTFPGVIVHEAAHFLFCRLFGLAVLDVVFFRFKNPVGYVVHEPTENLTAAFFVGLGPFFVNTALCIAFTLPAFVPVFELELVDPVGYFLTWLGISIGMHAFPSTHDLQNIRRLAWPAVKRGDVAAVAMLPVLGVFLVANLATVFWADLLYGLAVGVGLPRLVTQWLVT